MKMLVMSVCVVMSSVAAQAASLNPSKETIFPATIHQVINLVDKVSDSGDHKKLSAVVTDQGMSTDVSPRFTVYLGYASLAEMGNIWVNYKITDQAFMFVSATRKSAGIYEVVTVELRDEGLVEVTQTVDTTNMFAQEIKERAKCGGDFCDMELTAPITVTETTKKAQW